MREAVWKLGHRFSKTERNKTSWGDWERERANTNLNIIFLVVGCGYRTFLLEVLSWHLLTENGCPNFRPFSHRRQAQNQIEPNEKQPGDQHIKKKRMLNFLISPLSSIIFPFPASPHFSFLSVSLFLIYQKRTTELETIKTKKKKKERNVKECLPNSSWWCPCFFHYFFREKAILFCPVVLYFFLF